MAEEDRRHGTVGGVWGNTRDPGRGGLLKSYLGQKQLNAPWLKGRECERQSFLIIKTVPFSVLTFFKNKIVSRAFLNDSSGWPFHCGDNHRSFFSLLSIWPHGCKHFIGFRAQRNLIGNFQLRFILEHHSEPL